MSYVVLARKYRPQNFSQMVGQEAVVQALSNALATQRLHHAYLFTGTRGVGKTTVSRILAKSLNCQGPDGQGGITATPCGVCAACTEIDAGRFVDYTELDAASNRGVAEVQGLLEQAVYKPVQGRFKVFMIDEVHMLTGHAFNAMLKTLEEPPEYLKFVLATTDPQKVPVTVLSRCLQFNLRPMAPETVQEHLARVLQAEGVTFEPAALRLLARAARGSMRDALSLTDQAIAYGGGALQEAAVRHMLGSADRGHVLRLIEALARGDGRTVVETAEAMRAAGLNPAATLEEMSAVLQRMAVRQAVPGWGAETDDPDAAEVARLAALMPRDETQLLYSLCLHGRTELGLAPDEYAGLSMVLLRLLAFKPAPSSVPAEKKSLNPPPAPAPAPETRALAGSSEDFDRNPSAKRSVDASKIVAVPLREPASPAAHLVAPQPSPSVAGSAPFAPDGPSSAAQPVPAPETAPSALPDTVVAVPLVVPAAPAKLRAVPPLDAAAGGPALGDAWHALVRELVASERVTALVRELALQSELVAREGEVWTLHVEAESLLQASTRERLQAALCEAVGAPVRLQVKAAAASDTPARRNARAAAERLRAAEALAQNDPFTQAMVRDFGARIVPGSITPL
jgi:DNA polymerase-3 subunit gamma/tau